eukprot:gene16705-20430_t
MSGAAESTNYHLVKMFEVSGSEANYCRIQPEHLRNAVPEMDNASFAQKAPNLSYEAIPGTKPRNIIFILSDDHRYDFMGFTGKVPGLKTPNLDRIAIEG